MASSSTADQHELKTLQIRCKELGITAEDEETLDFLGSASIPHAIIFAMTCIENAELKLNTADIVKSSMESTYGKTINNFKQPPIQVNTAVKPSVSGNARKDRIKDSQGKMEDEAVVIPDDAASMWRSLDPTTRAALIASESDRAGLKEESDSGVREAPHNNNYYGWSSTQLLTEAERLITFTDAVVAIAMTLLILPLMEASADFQDLETIQIFFHDHWQNFLALWISFFVIWKFWLVHEHIFLRVRYFNQSLLWLNFFWMFGIVLLPIFTNCLVGPGDGHVKGRAVALYIADLVFLKICAFFIVLAIWKDDRIWKVSHGHGLVPAYFVALGVDIVLYSLAMLLCALFHWAFFAVIFLGDPVLKFAEWKWPQIGVRHHVFGGDGIWQRLWLLLSIPRLIRRLLAQHSA
uniref:Endosomal/lysosomal potassium channel TMEM175 n=1 Tax=Attheya septentrionalis TaxID=420275 RepID=A0A7S2U4L5_9STRA|mmetsp:Transcript_10192/g.18543  ORF Transcript_10192/g.18543 Transcript_10192/m.18543 type:complete len:408 (+) Transcript_10192:391-1614(+)